MSPRKSVRSLFDFCFDLLVRSLTRQIERNCRKINFFSCFSSASDEFLKRSQGTKQLLDEMLAGSLRWSLLQRFLQDSSLGHSTRLAAFLLLRDPLQPSLSFGHFPEPAFPLLASLLDKLTGLYRLNLRWIWLQGDGLRILKQALPNLTQLTHLHIPYIADDRLVAAVGRHCPRLEFLDLSGHSDLVTDGGIRAIYRVNVGGELWPAELTGSLRHLLLGGPAGRRLDPAAVGQLLLKLPQLANLGSYPYTAEAVRKSVGRLTGRKLSLRYLHDQRTASQGWEEVAGACPCLESVFFDTPDKEVLQQLILLPSVRRLKLNKVDMNELLDWLDKDLISLDLVTSSGTLDLGRLGRLCPNLTSLHIYYSNQVSALSSVQFSRLTKVVIYSTDVSGAAAADILQFSPNLSHVTLQSATSLDLDLLTNILAQGGLGKVQEFALMSAPLLGLVCLELLVLSLPRLKMVGRLEGWNIRSSGELDILRAKLKSENYDITMWYNLPLHVEMGMDQDLLDL